jgi:two-component sensor histidine kinase
MNTSQRHIYDPYMVVSRLPDNVAVLDTNGVILHVNDNWRKFAYDNSLDPDECSEGTNYLRVCDESKDDYSEQAKFASQGIRDVISGEKDIFEMEYPCHSPYKYRWFMMKVIPISDTFPSQVIIHHINITKRKLAEISLQEYAKGLEKINDELEDRIKERTKDLEKAEELREKEMHHRVKNNLQIISSLLELQSSNFKDREIVEAFEESRNRVISMAIAHENLYRTTNLGSIQFDVYVKSLVNHLLFNYQNNKEISINLDIDDCHHFDLDTIIPLGLIINELVTNSLIHAFTGIGKVNISLSICNNQNEYVLIVSDDGIGFPDDIDVKNTDSLGLQLINMLVEQIKGDIELDKNMHGTVFIIRFIS